MTEYLILRQDDTGHWEVGVGLKNAASPNAAIRAAVTEDGAYVAIPSRSWKPLEVTFQTKPVITIGGQPVVELGGHS